MHFVSSWWWTWRRPKQGERQKTSSNKLANCCIWLVNLFELYDDARTCQSQMYRRTFCPSVCLSVIGLRHHSHHTLFIASNTMCIPRMHFSHQANSRLSMLSANDTILNEDLMSGKPTAKWNNFLTTLKIQAASSFEKSITNNTT
jgi:hypothetical protein